MTTHLYPLPTSIPLGNWIYLYKIKLYNADLILYFLFIAISIYQFKFLFNTNFGVIQGSFNFYFISSNFFQMTIK